MKTYTFLKRGSDWYIDLPEYIAQGGNVGDLQMVDGADEMLDMMSNNTGMVAANISKEPFDNADRLLLTEKCDDTIGGGYYLMRTYKGEEINKKMWLCQVTEFVFGELPEQIFIRQETI